MADECLMKVMIYGEDGSRLKELYTCLCELKEKGKVTLKDITEKLQFSMPSDEGGEMDYIQGYDGVRFFMDIIAYWCACPDFLSELCKKYDVSYCYSALLSESDFFEVVGDVEEEVFPDNIFVDVWEPENEMGLSDDGEPICEFFKTEEDVVCYLNEHAAETYYTYLAWQERFDQLDCGKILACKRKERYV